MILYNDLERQEPLFCTYGSNKKIEAQERESARGVWVTQVAKCLPLAFSSDRGLGVRGLSPEPSPMLNGVCFRILSPLLPLPPARLHSLSLSPKSISLF